MLVLFALRPTAHDGVTNSIPYRDWWVLGQKVMECQFQQRVEAPSPRRHDIVSATNLAC